MLATITEKLLRKLSNKEYRDAFVDANVRTGLAYQIRALRDQREWSQEDLAEAMETKQSVVSRMEDPDYGRLSVSSLIEAAAAFDVGLLIKFVSFPELILRTRDVSPRALEVQSWNEAQFTTKAAVAYSDRTTPPVTFSYGSNAASTSTREVSPTANSPRELVSE